MKGRVLSLIALGVAFGMLGAAFPFGSLPTMVLAFFAVASFLGAFILGVQERRFDPYSLESLRKVQDEEELRSLEVEEEHDFGSVVCPACQNVYDSRLPACPNCGRAF